MKLNDQTVSILCKALEAGLSVVACCGIAGISASYFLSSKYDVHLFEKNNYLGGHTRTVKVTTDKNLSIDTGFIVFNDRNYPDLIKFFD